MWVAIGIISLAVVMVVGPVMMMQPSKSTKRLADLRAQAAQKHLRVRMAPNPSSFEPKQIAVYSSYWQGEAAPEKLKQLDVLLVRQNYEHEAHFFKDWEWQKSTLDVKDKEGFLGLLASLPKEIHALEMNNIGVSLYWSERISGKNDEQSLDFISHALEQAKTFSLS